MNYSQKIILFFFFLTLSVSSVRAEANDTLGIHLPDADELHLSFDQETVPDGVSVSYMRIVLDRKIESGKWTLIVLPAALDGYYFGPDAERFMVTACDLTTYPVTLQRAKMSDLDDFAANQMYLIKSESDMDQIVVMSPGVRTALPSGEGVTLLCLTLNDFQDPSATDKVASTPSSRILLSGNVRYDMSGCLSKSVRGGIYILNGKKIFVK